MAIAEINRVCFVGAGTMGCYNSIVAAVSGYDVVLYDVSEQTLQQVPQRHTELAAQLVAHGYCSEEAIPVALARVSLVADLEQAVAGVDLVSESVFERIDIKRDTHRALDQACPDYTILTTNSSALLVSDIEDVVARGDRFAAMHSHLGSPLVDIVGGPRTSAATIDVLQRYVQSTGGVPLVLKKEYPGYVLNAMLGPVLSSGMQLLIEGVATIDEIDRTWMISRQAGAGPFGLMDLFGLNLIYDSWQYREDAAIAELKPKIIELLGPRVERGELGVKSGRGFYQYPAADYQQPGFLEAGCELPEVDNALMTALIGNALVVAANDVLEPADIDRAWMTGMFQNIGPFGILEQLGVAQFQQILADQVAAGRFDGHKGQIALGYLRQNMTPV